jgi:KDO2-lipid IV(A) lauroyltransferase
MAKHGKLQTTLEYIPARIILFGLGLLPPHLAISVGKSLGRIAYSLAGRLRRTGHRNLELAFPEKSEQERDEIVRACFISLGRILGLFSQFSTRSAETLRQLFDINGLEHLSSAKAQGKGVICFTAHLGAWELTALSLSLFDYPISFLVRRIDNDLVERLIDKSRQRFGNKTLDKLSAARSMVKTLRSGELLGLLTDLNTLDDEAIFVDFFGVPAATNFMVAKLALRTNSPIVPIFAPWDEARERYVVTIYPPIRPKPTGNEDDDVRALTTQLSRTIEDQILHHPGQWLWIHKRWKTRPPGGPAIY